jgi:hypothetical protein
MKKILSILAIGTCTLVQAQTLDNMLDLTSVQTHGTARYTALGGAFTALGNDISGLHYNPAGIGVFRRDHINFSFGIQGTTSNTTYGGVSDNDLRANILFENLGFVKTFKGKGNNSFAFGLSYVKKANFDRNVRASTVNSQGETLADFWFLNAQGATPEELLNDGWLEERLAYDNFLFDLDSSGTIGIANFTTDASINQSYVIDKTGGSHDFAVSFGGRYKRYLNWGVSLNVPYTSTYTISTYRESGFAANSDLNNHFIVREEGFSATGINANFGIIFTPAQWVRLAASYQTPTPYRYFSNYTIDATTAFNNGDQFNAEPFVSNDAGRMLTPAVLRAGLAFVVGKAGFISASYERSDLDNSSTDFDFDQTQINNNLGVRETFRLGAELRLQQYFLRGGYVYTSNPFQGDAAFYENRNMYTGGVGYRTKNYAFNISYVQSQTNRNLATYGTDSNDLVEDLSQGNLVLGLSVMF